MPNTPRLADKPATRKLLIRSAPALGLYLLLLAWASYSFVCIPDGTQDPIFKLTGVPRTSQILLATFLLVAYLGSCGLALIRMRPWMELNTARAGITLFFSLLFLNILSATAPTMVAQIYPGFLPQLFGYVALVLAVQAATILVAVSVLSTPRAILVLFVALILVDFYAMYIVFLESFHRRHAVGQVSIFGIAFLVLVYLYTVACKGIVPLRSLNTVLAITMVTPAILILSNHGSVIDRNGLLAKFDDVEFRSFPNVHIVSFDALVAPSLASKYLKLGDVPYKPLLSRKGVTVFANTFSSRVPTKPFANSVMRLAHPGFPEVYSYFAGRTDSPLAHVFRTNGYRVSTGYSNMYFGMKGPYVSDYHPRETLDIRNNTLCALAMNSPVKFFGFCRVAALFNENQREAHWPNTVIDIIRQANADTNPWLTFHHIGIPGHTNLGYRTSDSSAFRRYREIYQKGSASAAAVLEELMSILQDDDAQSILLVFGDHGPYLSRTVTIEQDPRFFVQDRYGTIATVLHNETSCGPKALHHYIEGYTTPERIIAALIRCLSIDPQIMDATVKFTEDLDFNRYLYE